MKTKGRLFWTRLLTMMALCIAALIAGLSFGMTSAYAENADKAASSEDGGVSVLALPEGVTVTGITGVELTGTVTTASSYAEIKAALAVTATGSDGETYELDPDEFEVVGVFEDGAIETNTFRIVCGTVTSEATFEMSGEPVRNDAVRSITAEYVNDGSTMLYSYSSLEFDVKDMVQVTRWTWAGEGTIAGSEEFVLEGQLTPSRAGQTQPYSKEITVRRFIGDETSNISCTLEIPDIQPAAPSAIRITTAPGTVVAFSKIDPAAWVLQVEYEDDPWGNAFEIPLSMVTVQYADASGETTDEEGNPYEGFVYDGGRGQVIFSYSENGETVTVRRQIAVSRVSISQVYFLGVGEYKYSVTENNEVEGTDQTASIVNYNSGIMKIASVSLSGSQASVPFDTQAGTITVCDAGTYTVRVELTNAAYYFENRQAPDDTYMEIEYVVDPVEPPIEIEWSENAYDGEDLKWDRDDNVSFELLKNYGNGEVTYTYRRTDGSTTTGTAEDPNLPNETGTYTLTVKVEANGNFAAFEGELATFTVGQRVIGLPTLNDPDVNDGNLVYNGAEQEASITYAGGEGDADYLDVVDTGGKNVGTYTVTFTIKDQYADEAEWDSSIVNGDGVTIDGNTLTLTYQITKLSIAVPNFNNFAGTFTYNGYGHTVALGNWYPSAGLEIDSPVRLSIEGDGEGDTASADQAIGTVTATNAGTYTIKVSLGDTDNLQWAGGTSVDDLGFSWTIDKATVTIPDAGSKTYTGGALTSDLADTDYYTVSQETDWVNAGDYDVTLTLTDATNYKWSDGREDGSITVTFTIDPRAVTIDWDEKTFSFIYDGNSHVASASVGNKIGQDDVSFVIRGEQTNANTNGTSYTATIESLAGDQAGNYTLTGASGSTTQTFTIAPRSIGIVWGTTTNEYDGESWHPEAASFTNVIEGDSVGTLTYDGAKTDAGTNYTVTVTAVSNSNYTVSGGTDISTTFTITPRVLEGAWGTNTNVYSGGSWHPVFTPSNVLSRDTIALAYSGAQINAGTGYVAQIVEITGMGAGNYTLEGMANPTCGFEITRVQLTRPTEDTTTFTYTGEN